MTADEICKCGHAGRDHGKKVCLVAACDCRTAIRADPQPYVQSAMDSGTTASWIGGGRPISLI